MRSARENTQALMQMVFVLFRKWSEDGRRELCDIRSKSIQSNALAALNVHSFTSNKMQTILRSLHCVTTFLTLCLRLHFYSTTDVDMELRHINLQRCHVVRLFFVTASHGVPWSVTLYCPVCPSLSEHASCRGRNQSLTWTLQVKSAGGLRLVNHTYRTPTHPLDPGQDPLRVEFIKAKLMQVRIWLPITDFAVCGGIM